MQPHKVGRTAPASCAGVVACVRLLGGGSAIHGQEAVDRGAVRSSDAGLTRLIGDGTQWSSTFRALVRAIENAQGIVYVEQGECGRGVRACLLMWTVVNGPHRYLRVALGPAKGRSDAERLSAIGHELQHAAEGLQEPTVVNGAAMHQFFSRLGPLQQGRFETSAAMNMGDAIYQEVKRRR